jgi:hypothetical protein
MFWGLNNHQSLSFPDIRTESEKHLSPLELVKKYYPSFDTMTIIANIKAEDRKFKRTGKVSKKKEAKDLKTPSLTSVAHIKKEISKKRSSKHATPSTKKSTALKKTSGTTKIKKEKVVQEDVSVKPVRQDSTLVEPSSPSPIDDEAFETPKESQ